MKHTTISGAARDARAGKPPQALVRALFVVACLAGPSRAQGTDTLTVRADSGSARWRPVILGTQVDLIHQRLLPFHAAYRGPNSSNVELELHLPVGAAVVRALAFENEARMGLCCEAIAMAGNLRYGQEQVVEACCRIQWGTHVEVSPDYQDIINPGYNATAGPRASSRCG